MFVRSRSYRATISLFFLAISALPPCAQASAFLGRRSVKSSPYGVRGIQACNRAICTPNGFAGVRVSGTCGAGVVSDSSSIEGRYFMRGIGSSSSRGVDAAETDVNLLMATTTSATNGAIPGLLGRSVSVYGSSHMPLSRLYGNNRRRHQVYDDRRSEGKRENGKVRGSSLVAHARPPDLSDVPEAEISVLEKRFGHLEEKEMYRRIRISLKRKGRQSASRGYSHSAEMRRKISEKTREALARPEIKQKMKALRPGSISPDVRKKIGEAVSKTYAKMPASKKAKSEEHRRKISESIRKKWEDKEYRERATIGMSKAMKEKWEDPKYREAKREGMIKAASPKDITDVSAPAKTRSPRKVKPAPITKEAEDIITNAQKLQEIRTKVVRLANSVEQLAIQVNDDPKVEEVVDKARRNLDALRNKIDKMSLKLKVNLRKYLNVRAGKLSRRALMSEVFEQFELKNLYEETLETLSTAATTTSQASATSSSESKAATGGQGTPDNPQSEVVEDQEDATEEEGHLSSDYYNSGEDGDEWNLDLDAMRSL